MILETVTKEEVNWVMSLLFCILDVMDFWFKKRFNGRVLYSSRVISIRFIPRHCNKLHCGSNGAVKGIDKCYDYNICFFGLMISYTNFDYDLK